MKLITALSLDFAYNESLAWLCVRICFYTILVVIWHRPIHIKMMISITLYLYALFGVDPRAAMI